MSDTTTVILALVPTISATVAAIVGMLNNTLARRNGARLDEQSNHNIDSRAMIERLEKNTNSIKDALVQTTADASYAKGLKAGTEAAEAKL